jgi:hypothetical protein
VGGYRGGHATAVDGVRGSVLACLGRQYRRQKIKIQYGMALEQQQNITTDQMFTVGGYRGGHATAVDGVRGSVLACLGRRYRRQKIKIQYVMALERQQNITTNQMFTVGGYRGGRATAVDGVRGSVLACLGR